MADVIFYTCLILMAGAIIVGIIYSAKTIISAKSLTEEKLKRFKRSIYILVPTVFILSIATTTAFLTDADRYLDSLFYVAVAIKVLGLIFTIVGVIVVIRYLLKTGLPN
jgi:ABC-type multidrug transport system permease subunit